MPSFTYIAISSAGQQSSGKVQASSRADAFKKLEAQALTPVKVTEEASQTKRKAVEEATSAEPVRLKRAQMILFTEELADLLDGGLQIDQALRILEERQDSVAIKRISGILRNELREGATVSKALKKASPSFDDLYLNLVSAGEVTGSLSEVLRRLAANMTVIQELQSKVTQAMIYPALLILACIALLIVFMTVLVPQLTDLLKDSGTKMPLATELLMSFSAFLGNWWWLLVSVAVGGFILFKGYVSTPKGKMWWHQNQLQLPLFGPVISTRLYAQFASSLGNLVTNGVPLLNGLKLAARAMTNVHLQEVLARAVGLVGEGAPLSSSLKKVGSFPNLMVDMIAVGEQTGALGKSLEKSAVRYDKELDKKIKRLTTLISPVIMIFMAVIVGVVAYSIVTAIFQTSQGIRGKA
ncbi:MAG: type II secretion system F family protein [Verrucomicrobiaceae bacterium]|nr:type II secretion system F family protein [Verrucomicrobiaceae bacterium]